MFSPDASTSTHSLRPKRSRQAAGNDDSLKLPQAKRKRSALRRDTFEPLAEASVNEIAGRQNDASKTKGHAAETKPSTVQPAVQSKELTVRGGKKADKRSERGATASILSSNDFYTVSQLPALPDVIRNRPTVPYSCLLSSEHGYALALTHTEAVIWPYNHGSSALSTRDVVSFKLPLPPASESDPLPLGAFTARDASGEPGLVVVAPKGGKVIFWETITNASTIIPGQTSNGVQGSISGMFGGETVKEIVNAEPAGFVLTFSHGRVAHMSVRDQMGRPAIHAQFLRKPSPSTNPIFGSIRNVFGGDRRKGTSMVRAGAAAKGQRAIVVLTEDGELEEWDITLNGSASPKLNFSMKEALLQALSPHAQQRNGSLLQFNVLDFELAGSRHRVARRDSPTGFPITALVSLSVDGWSNYFILEMIVREAGAEVTVVHPIKCFADPVANSTSRRPCLSISKSCKLAFVVFETSVVLFSLARIEESPSSQLLSNRLPDPFQDCIRFQEDAIYKVLNYVDEEQDGKPACLVAVQGFGIIRILSKLRDFEDIDVDDYHDRISAKSKIEQAVFFGTIKQNPLDLNRSTNEAYSAEEVESAALAISAEILSSESKYLPKSAPSIDNLLKQRAKALDDLTTHLVKYYSSQISRNVRYQLLWNAEKLAAAQAIWKAQEDIARRYPLADREMCYLDFCLRALHETRQKYPDEEKGEKDRVRHWLLNSINQIHFLLIELVDCFKELHDMDVTDPKVVGEYMKEALDLWTGAYTAAFKFREDNAGQYGLGDDIFKDGILVAGYPPEVGHPWTSLIQVFKHGQKLIVDLIAYMDEWWDFDPTSAKGRKKKMPTDVDGKAHDAPPKALLNHIAAKLPTLVELFNRLVTEQITQAVRRAEREPDPEARQERIWEVKSDKRPFQTGAIMQIRKFNMPGAIELAENLRDPGLLVALTTEYLKTLTVNAHNDPQHVVKYQSKRKEVQDQAETYFDRFGKGWAYASFSRMIQDGFLGSLFTTAQSDDKKQDYLTWFMKRGQKLGQKVGRISWINDIVGEENYGGAGKTLKEVAVEDNADIWKKKTELSLAKLASLAAAEAKEEATGQPGSDEDALDYDHKMQLLDMQAEVLTHVENAVGPALDAKAVQDLAMETFAVRVVEKTPALKKLLKKALQSLLAKQPLSVEELIDLLTLVDPVAWEGEPEEDPDVCGNEFSIALRAIEICDLSEMHKDALRQVVWRRAMIRDNWNILNDTTNKTDEEVEAQMQVTTVFRTLLVLFEDAAQQQALMGVNAAQMVEHQLFSPTQLLEAQNVVPHVLQERFCGDEKEREAIRKDMETEQVKLKEFVEKAQLEKHFTGLVTDAERIMREVIDREGEENAEGLMDGEGV